MVMDLSDLFVSTFPKTDTALDQFIQGVEVRLIGCGVKSTDMRAIDSFTIPAFLLVHYSRGSVEITHGEQRTILVPGSFYMFRPFEIYSGRSLSDVTPSFVFLRFDISPYTARYNFGRLAMETPDQLYLQEHYLRMGEVLDDISSADRSKPGWGSLLAQFVKCIVAQIAFDRYSHSLPADFIRSGRDARLINQAFRYASEHLSEPISISQLVQDTYTSKTSLDRAFRASLHTSPQQALTRFKMERAMEMLQREIPVKDIARELGYSSVYHFSNTFKAVTGQRPTAYIKNLRNIGRTFPTSSEPG